MSEGLCWKCKEYWDKHTPKEMEPWIHCPHEPKEKPEVKCWACEDHDWVIKWNATVRGSNIDNYAVTIAKCCPECGRKL